MTRDTHPRATENISRIVGRPPAMAVGGRAHRTDARASRGVTRAVASDVNTKGFSRRNIIHIFIAHARGFERTHTHTTTQA